MGFDSHFGWYRDSELTLFLADSLWIYLFFHPSIWLSICIYPSSNDSFLISLFVWRLLSFYSSSYPTLYSYSQKTIVNVVDFFVLESGLSICLQMDTVYEIINLYAFLFLGWTPSLVHKNKTMDGSQVFSISAVCFYLFSESLIYY